MHSKVNLEEQFSYNSIGIILFNILLLCLITYIVYKIIEKEKTIKKEVPDFKTTRDIIRIKNNYLNQINILYAELNSNHIKSRTAYNRLSILIRKFVKEVTGIDLLKCSLSEIKKKDTGILYELIKEYYEPEFSKNNKGDIISSINKTRKVIEEWK